MGADFGDIAGLHELARTLNKAAPEFDSAGHALNTQVSDLTGDAWTGQAAQKFSTAWGRDAKGAGAVSDSLTHISTTVDKLASSLGEAKRKYDHAVASAREAGVPILEPREQTVLPAGELAKSQEFSAQANSAVTTADAARKQAAAELRPLAAALDPEAARTPMSAQQAAELKKMGLGDYVKVGAAAADLYAAPAVATSVQSARVAKVEQRYLDAKGAYSEAGGKNSSEYRELKAAKKGALQELKAARGELGKVEKVAGKFHGSRAASTTLEDPLNSIGKDLSKLKIVKAAPVVDVAATGYNIYNDINHGWNPAEAAVADSTDTLAGVGATAGVVALAPEAAPAVAVAGAGVVVGYEATEAVTALTHDAHWGENIQKYGVVDGIGHSFADAGSAFVHNNVETAKKVGNTIADAAQGVWHGISGLF
jgi:uncharacterized protein YukE